MKPSRHCENFRKGELTFLAIGSLQQTSLEISSGHSASLRCLGETRPNVMLCLLPVMRVHKLERSTDVRVVRE